jgi:serine/threonine protein kinase
MRNRHFSPETINYSSNFSLLSPSHQRLKLAGSTSKLKSYNSTLLCESDRKVGNYSYSSTEEIGSGYSSKVYRGRSTKDNSECAVKVIELKRYSEQSLRMLDNEIQILKTLDHPNVIKCYDIYKTQSHCYIITELCSNGDLLNYLTRRGKL